MTATLSVAAVKRLRWRCRRGMRELDVLLSAYFDRHAGNFAAAEQALFERLLDESDVDLYAWLTRGTPPRHDYAVLVERILSAAGSAGEGST